MDTLFVALRVLLSLGAVLALLWLLQRRFARGGIGAKAKARSAASLAVVGRQSVGPKASVVVVEHDGQRLLLGVTEHGVSVLHTATMEPVAAPASELDGGAADAGHAQFARVLAEASQPATHTRAAEPVVAELFGAELLVAEPLLATRRNAATASATAGRPAGSTPASSTPAGSTLAGSILAPGTWKQAAAAVRGRW